MIKFGSLVLVLFLAGLSLLVVPGGTRAVLPDAVTDANPVPADTVPAPTATVAPGDLMLRGVVYAVPATPTASATAEGTPIAGARVAAILCVPRSYVAFTDADGRYELLIPAAYASACTELTLGVSADGYATQQQTFLLADLWAQPVRDWTLTPLPPSLWFPVVLR